MGVFGVRSIDDENASVDGSRAAEKSTFITRRWEREYDCHAETPDFTRAAAKCD